MREPTQEELDMLHVVEDAGTRGLPEDEICARTRAISRMRAEIETLQAILKVWEDRKIAVSGVENGEPVFIEAKTKAHRQQESRRRR